MTTTEKETQSDNIQGSLPNWWIESTLGENCEISSSKRIFAEEYKSFWVPFYRWKEIIEKFNGWEISTELFITEEKYNEIKSRFDVPEAWDMLLTSVGTIWIPYIVREKERFYFKDGNLTWFKKFTTIYNKFLYYWIISDIWKEEIQRRKIWSTQEALTIVWLKNIPIHLPPIPEQKAITSILSSFDNKIELLREENKTLEQTAQTIFQEWFGKYGVDDELPEGWRIKKLGEEFNISIWRTPSRAESQWFSNIPIGKKWISIKDIGNCGVYIFDTSEYLTDESIKKFNIPVIPENTTILSFKMTVGKLTITTEEMLSNEAIAHLKIRDNSDLTSEFIYCYLQALDFNALGSTSSIVTAINSTMIKEIEVIVPDEWTLWNFNSLIKPIFEKIKSNSKQIQSLSQTRDELLPRLMKGEVRVEF